MVLKVKIISAALLLIIMLHSQTGLAQRVPAESLNLKIADNWQLIEGRVAGDQVVEYELLAPKDALLSVDMRTTNTSNYFNISKFGADKSLFIGSVAGTVADVKLTMSGRYLVRVYLMRNAARRGEHANYSISIGLNAPDFADSLSSGPDYWKVSGLERSSLNLRQGPDTRYSVVAPLRNGALLLNQACRISNGIKWCNVRVHGTGNKGWVVGRYLVEGATPLSMTPPDRPVGNGLPFDATGYIPCSSGIVSQRRSCPFGAIWNGPGNAGVWIKGVASVERHILFEGGKPITSNAEMTPSFTHIGDYFKIKIGEKHY